MIIKSFKTKAGAVFIALGSVIEHNIQNHINAVVVQGFDQFLEFPALLVIFHGRGVTGVWGEETDRIVAPVVQQLVIVQQPCIAHLIKLKDRHQLHGIDAELLQVWDLFFQPPEGAGMFYTGGIIFGKASDVGLIDDHIFHGDLRLAFPSPVEIIAHNARPVAVL